MQRDLEKAIKNPFLKMRESCTFSDQIFHVVLVFSFPCHSPFRINTTDCPCHMVDAHISTRNFLIQQLLVQRYKQNTCQNNEVMCWNEEFKTRPFPIVKYCNLHRLHIANPWSSFGLWLKDVNMSMWQSIVHVCSNVGNLGKHKMLKTFHLETVESSGITKHTGICNVDATNCSYIVQTRPKYSGWFHVSNTATTRPMRFKLHSKMFSKSALPVVHFSSMIRCWLFTKKHMKKNLGVASTQNI